MGWAVGHGFNRGLSIGPRFALEKYGSVRANHGLGMGLAWVPHQILYFTNICLPTNAISKDFNGSGNVEDMEI